MNKLTLAVAGTEVTTYSNDAAGNRTAEVPSTGDSSLYAWDAPGRMASADVTAGIASFTYNTDGQRVVKQSTDGSVTGFLYDHKRLLQETDDVGGDVTKMYASSTTDEFGDLIGEDGEYTHVYDAQANTNALLDTSGMVEAAYKYDAFCAISAVSVEGGAWSPVDWPTLPAELSSNMLAGGKKQYYLDTETELYLLGGGTNGRYYDAGIGRFVSEDPIRQAGEDPNLFGYVKNDPINKLDPNGHDQASDDAARKAADAAKASAKQDHEAQARLLQAVQANGLQRGGLRTCSTMVCHEEPGLPPGPSLVPTVGHEDILGGRLTPPPAPANPRDDTHGQLPGSGLVFGPPVPPDLDKSSRSSDEPPAGWPDLLTMIRQERAEAAKKFLAARAAARAAESARQGGPQIRETREIDDGLTPSQRQDFTKWGLRDAQEHESTGGLTFHDRDLLNQYRGVVESNRFWAASAANAEKNGRLAELGNRMFNPQSTGNVWDALIAFGGMTADVSPVFNRTFP